MQSKHGSLESAIMSVLWNLEQKGELKNSVKDVFDTLAKNESEKRAYTTIKTVMDRLHEKKVLVRYKEGKKFYYRTLYTNQEAIVKSLTEVCHRYCGGDMQKLSLMCNSMVNKSQLASV